MNAFEKRAKKVAGYTPKKSNNSVDSYSDNTFAKRAEEIQKRNTIRTAQMKRDANDWLNQYNKLLDDVNEIGFSKENADKFDSLRIGYDRVSGVFTTDARKQLQDSFASIKNYFGGFTGSLSNIQYPEQIDYRRADLQKSYQDALDEAIEANPGVSLHNLPYTDDMKFIREQMDELDAFEKAQESADYNRSRSGKFEYDPKYDSSIPFRGMGRYTENTPSVKEPDNSELERAKEEYEAAYAQYQIAEENYYSVPDGDFQKAEDDYLAADARLAEAEERVKKAEQDFEAQKKDNGAASNGRRIVLDGTPQKKTFSDYITNRTTSELAEKGWSQFQEDDAAKETDRQAVQEWLSKPHIGVSPLEMAVLNLEADDSYKLPSDNWNDEERTVYGILYQYDKEKAERFAIETNNAYKKAERESQTTAVKEFANDHPILSTIGGISSNVVGTGMADFFASGIEQLSRGETTEHNYISPHQAGDVMKGTVSQNLNDRFGTIDDGVPVFGGRGFGDAYQLLNSVVESALTANLTGVIGTYLIFFGNAAASAMDDAKKRGATDDQAFNSAVIAGAAEALGEHFSASHLLEMTNAGTIKAFFGSLFGQAFEEGEEELFTSIVNNLADNYIMQDKSNFQIYVKKYMEAHPAATKEEAEKEAWKNMWSDMAFDFVGGFASGGIHTGMQAGVNKVRSDIYYKNTYGDYSRELVQKGLESPEGTQSRTLAEKYQQKLDTGKGLSGRDLRRLVNANEEQFSKEDTETGSEVDTEMGGNVVDSEMETTTEVTESGFTVKNADGYTEIRFKENPSRELSDALEENGFIYRDANNAWYGRKSTEEARKLVLENSAEQSGDDGENPAASSDASEDTTEIAEVQETGFTVGKDSEHGTTVISFEEVPPKEVQAALKENGFKFSSKNKVWYGNATTEQTSEIVHAAMEPAVEQENRSPSDGKTVNRAHDVSVEAVAETDKNNLDLQKNGEEPGTAEEEHPVTTSLSFGRGSEKKSTLAAEADRPFEISKTAGKTFLNREDGSTVETRITGIASSEKGNLMLNVAGEDSPVRASDISYPDSGEESLYYFLNQMQLKPYSANMIVDRAKESVSGMDGAAKAEKMAEFAQGIFGMYSLGENGVPLEKALNSKYGKNLTEEMKLFGHGLGKSVYDAKSSETKENAGGKETPKNTGKNASAKGAAVNEIQILRNAVDNISSLSLSEKEKNSLGVFAEHLKKLDSVQQQAETIRGKESALTDYERDKLTRLEKQADNIKKKLWDFAQYPLLKSVSAKARELMQQEYGAIEAGENPTRAAELPAKTDSSNRVSKTARTAVEAAVTTDEAATRIREKAVEGEFSYLPITDKEAQKRAEDTILRKGWNDALSDWRVGMSKTGFPGKEMVTLGFQLYNNAVNAGDSRTAVQILTDITNTVRNSAQTVQAVRILKKLSPENRLYAIQRQLGSLQDELNRKYGDRAPQIDMNSTLAENYRNAKGEENIRAAEEALFRDIAAQLPNTFADKWNSWRYLSMLGNVRTHVRNVLGNVGFVPVRATKDLIASGMEKVVDKLSKNGIDRTKSVLNPLKEADRALYTAGMEDYAAAEELLSSANLKSGDSISRIEQYKPAFGGDKAIWRALSKVAEANSNALSFEDMLFKKTTYASAFAGYLKANDITAKMLQNGEVTESFLDNARAYAFQEALKATYNDVNSFSNFVASFGNLRYSSNSVAKAAGFLVEGVLPFKRTPANIVARAVEYSPIGMVNGIKKSLVDVRSGKVTAAEAIDTLASGLTGTVLLGLGGLLASMGLVSGGDDDDDKQKDFDKLRGKQSYALNAFGGSYTIDWLAPEIIPLFIGVELYNRVQEDGGIGFKDLLESFARVSNPLLEMSCLQSLNDLLDSVSYSDNKLYSIFSQAAANHVLQALPTLFGQIERVGETERETTYIDKSSQILKDLQYTIAKAANKIPGVEFEQIPYIDAYGRRQETGNLGTRMFTNLLSPGYLSSDRSAPWDNELERLYKLGFETVYPKRPTTKINQKELTAEEYVDHAEFTGRERYRLLELVLSSDYYKSKNDKEKADIIADVYNYVAAEGKYRYDKDISIPKWTKEAMEREKKGGSFIDVLKDREKDRSKDGK